MHFFWRGSINEGCCCSIKLFITYSKDLYYVRINEKVSKSFLTIIKAPIIHHRKNQTRNLLNNHTQQTISLKTCQKFFVVYYYYYYYSEVAFSRVQSHLCQDARSFEKRNGLWCFLKSKMVGRHAFHFSTKTLPHHALVSCLFSIYPHDTRRVSWGKKF